MNRLFVRKKRYGEDPFVFLSELDANKDRIFVFFSVFTSASARARTSRSFPCSPLFFTLISSLLHALRIRRDGSVKQSKRKRLKNVFILLQKLGCDLILNSNANEDKCRVCNGDGENCRTHKGVNTEDGDGELYLYYALFNLSHLESEQQFFSKQVHSLERLQYTNYFNSVFILRFHPILLYLFRFRI